MTLPWLRVCLKRVRIFWHSIRESDLIPEAAVTAQSVIDTGSEKERETGAKIKIEKRIEAGTGIETGTEIETGIGTGTGTGTAVMVTRTDVTVVGIDLTRRE